MNAKSGNSPTPGTDPDDAPELTAEFFDHGVWRIGDRVVSRAHAHAEDALRQRLRESGDTKVSVTIRLDAEILAVFRSHDPGWEDRINDALRDWLKSR